MDISSLTHIFTTAAVYGAPALVAVSAAKSSFFSNNQQEETLITRFGKHTKTVKDPGLNFKLPFIDKIYDRVSLQVVQATETLSTKTKKGDDIFVKLPITVQYQVSNSALYTFGNGDPVANMMKSVSNAVRAVTSDKSFQELYTMRGELSTEVIDHVEDEVAESGITLRRIIIDEPEAPEAVRSAYNNVRASEQAREAAKNNAEAEKIKVVAESEAAAEAQRNAGKGAADFRKAIFEGYKAQIDELTADEKMTREEALHIVQMSMSLDAVRDVAKHGNLIIVPQNFAGSEMTQVETLRRMASNDTAALPAPAVA